ncbi:MAG TPA: methylated-DNA--[protein]-cysteine S-methyltransferase [Streptosporangiaceae bacterium]
MTGRAWTMIRTPVGPLSVACTSAGLASVRFGPPGKAGPGQAGPVQAVPVQAVPVQAGPAQAGSGQPAEAAPGQDTAGQDAGGQDAAGQAASSPAAGLAATAGQQLAEYFSGQRRVFDLPLDWSVLSDLQRQVLGSLFETVGFGQTVTYGELARRSGIGERAGQLPARTIGQVMGSNPYPVIVPCHRVVAADGLGGYSGGTGIEIKRWLLIFEGAEPPTLDWAPDGPLP